MLYLLLPHSATLLLILILFTHFVADFMLQTDKMAKGKSSSNRWLTYHILAYSTVLLVVFGPWYALANGLCHWSTDYITSRLSSRRWKLAAEAQAIIADPTTGTDVKQWAAMNNAHHVHWFFVIIGFDQFLHAVMLIITIPLIFV
jgi:hypothetical protein